MRFMLEYLEFFHQFRATFPAGSSPFSQASALKRDLFFEAYSKFKLLHLCISQHKTHFPNMHRKHNIVNSPKMIQKMKYTHP